jgi:hypothetical protein
LPAVAGDQYAAAGLGLVALRAEIALAGGRPMRTAVERRAKLEPRISQESVFLGRCRRNLDAGFEREQRNPHFLRERTHRSHLRSDAAVVGLRRRELLARAQP